MEWAPIQLSLSPASLGSLPATSSVTFSVNSVGGVTLSEISRLPSNVSPALTVTPAPEPSPTSTAPAPSEPTPAPTVTVTQTVQPSPSEVSGTVKLDELQYLGITTGLVLLLLFVAALVAAQLRRP